MVLLVPPPPALAGYLDVVHTGVRALLTGRRWFGSDRAAGRPCGPFPARGAGPLAFGALDPAAVLPWSVGLLTVEGDSRWDRVPGWARLDHPELFAPTDRALFDVTLRR